ncbi:leucyl/phenylalanyl-tRNA--protein transferase [Arsenicicoccus dermatophilus]|uniref:leucyl/phenylalanyl-tRNA--protein transferase n=1 Tax=Arsenicicoccus dermatophilus TaxID=1076331 RepID=UPI0039170531
MTPVEPVPTSWELGVGEAAAGEDLVGYGADLSPGTVLAAYRVGLFPMGLGEGGGPPLGWWSPDPRGVLELDALRVSRSLRRSCRTFEVRVDTAFEEVVAACGDPSREGAWITPAIRQAYAELHRLGWAHSIETWRDGELVGGLYGIAVGGLFAGESMFHRVTDASKAALVALVDLLGRDLVEVRGGGGDRLVDVQWATDHLTSLGVSTLRRTDYLARLPRLLATRLPAAWC